MTELPTLEQPTHRHPLHLAGRTVLASLLLGLLGIAEARAAGMELRCDFNSDGYEDLAVGAPGNRLTPDQETAGSVHVFLGTEDGLSDESFDIYPNTDLIPGPDVIPESGTERLGARLACGDFNGDGRDDLVIGAEQTVHVLLSKSETILFHHQTSFGPTSRANWDLKNGGFGISGLAAGDIDGDGFDDLIVGSPNAGYAYGKEEVRSAGTVDIHWGASYGLDDHWFTPLLSLDVERDRLVGEAIALGDFNNDGFDDLIVGREGLYESTVVHGDGRGYPLGPEFFRGGTYDLKSNYPGDPLHPKRCCFDSGAVLATAVGDMNGDGYDDVVAQSVWGLALDVYYGSQTGLSDPLIVHLEEMPTIAAGIHVWDEELDELLDYCYAYEAWGGPPLTNKFVLEGPLPDGFEVGDYITFDEAVHPPPGNCFQETGKIYGLEPGPPGEISTVINDEPGFDIALADYDSNGLDEVVIGWKNRHVRRLPTGPGELFYLPIDPSGLPSAAEAVPYDFGLPSPGSAFGASLAAGDFNGDGVPDLAVGAPSYAESGAIVEFHGGGKVPLTHKNALTILSAGEEPEKEDEFGAALSTNAS